MSARRYAVVGKPVSHSLSPRIHALFARQFDLPIEYTAVEPDAKGFAETVKEFFAEGGCGMNVTLPYKKDAAAMADQCSNGAKIAGAANTLRLEEDGVISACNTDGPGLLRDLQARHGMDLAGKSVLLIGAGGASAGIMNSLLQTQPDAVTVVNRTSERAQELAARFDPQASAVDVELSVADINSGRQGQPYALVIHTTSAGHAGAELDIDASLLAGADFAYDLSYGEPARRFLDLASAAGVPRSADGLGMLVEQAALSFAYWEQLMPATDPVYEELVQDAG